MRICHFCNHAPLSLRDREYDSRLKIGPAGPSRICAGLEMETHPADFKFPCQGIADGYVHAGSIPCGKGASQAIGRRREVSESEACQTVGNDLRRTIHGLAAKKIGNHRHAPTKTVNTHVIVEAQV